MGKSRGEVVTGIPGLDVLLCGGVPEGHAVLVEGGPGTGKTIFGLQYLYAGAREFVEPGAYITFEELPEQLFKTAAHFGWDFKQMEREGKISMLCTSPLILKKELEQPGGLIDCWAHREGVKRIVIDSINHLDALGEAAKLSDILARFVFGLKRRGLTTVFIKDRAEGALKWWGRYAADAVLDLFYELKENGERRRELEVVKLRGKPMVGGRHRFVIGRRGLEVKPFAEESIQGSRQNVPKDSFFQRILPSSFQEGDAVALALASDFPLQSLERVFLKAYADAGVVSLRGERRGVREGIFPEDLSKNFRHVLDVQGQPCGEILRGLLEFLQAKKYKNLLLEGVPLPQGGELRPWGYSVRIFLEWLKEQRISCFSCFTHNGKSQDLSWVSREFARSVVLIGEIQKKAALADRGSRADRKEPQWEMIVRENHPKGASQRFALWLDGDLEAERLDPGLEG